ncbi:MAG TPA: bifunctional DNA-binding transcriptional regulator/O6-methylguanine-DNA methyltransferase Ada [Gemmatimonadaceae bacterium]|nr:bifunctional DNA-binding transcriptional regulator/O6-methylguanine-DNA methyltransferase Ada [Gemmatimonadaceae bacterium]
MTNLAHRSPVGTGSSNAARPADSVAWRAVLRHDASFDSRFVYAVSSTGIYCRPSCGSRRPRRNRVQFFDEPALARAAGFRACKRCQPDLHAPSLASAAIVRTVQYLTDHAGERTTLEFLASQAGLSRSHLQRVFKREVGLSPREFQDALRQRRFVERLRAGDTVSRATYEAGYGSSSRVYGRAEVRSALSPAVYRKGAAGLQVRYTVFDVPLGRMLVAFTGTGVCAVELGDSEDALVRTLRTNLPGAELERVSRAATPWAGQIAALARGRAPSAAIPLDVRGTAFQWKVWKALQRIPVGQTRSYAEMARAIGQPSAVRAVASACARNPVAVVVPCHRVVRGDGATGEYRWGNQRKAALLRLEQEGTLGRPRT